MSSYETITLEKEDGFAVVTLNRPDRLNTINSQMWKDLDSVLVEIESDNNIKAFIYTGAPRSDNRPCFCAGGDLKEMAGVESAEKEAPSTDSGTAGPIAPPSASATFFARRRPRVSPIPTFENIAWSPKISIAAIDGVCTAGGIELALSCDIILVAETARISDMHVKNLGWIGGGGAPTNMAWRVGPSKAIELCCLGNEINGQEAYRIGLANQVYPSDRLLEEAKEMARALGRMRISALTMTKALCQSVQDMDRSSSWRYCEDGFEVLAGEQDNVDFGPAQWVDKKK